MEAKVKLILKGILLYTTIILSLFFVIGIDSIYDKSFFVEYLVAIVSLIYACSKVITEKEYAKIMFIKSINKF